MSSKVHIMNLQQTEIIHQMSNFEPSHLKSLKTKTGLIENANVAVAARGCINQNVSVWAVKTFRRTIQKFVSEAQCTTGSLVNRKHLNERFSWYKHVSACQAWISARDVYTWSESKSKKKKMHLCNCDPSVTKDICISLRKARSHALGIVLLWMTVWSQRFLLPPT